jgi:plastocyanin
MKLNHLMGLAALAASVQFLSAADVTGKVTLKGNAPPAQEATLDKVCGDLLGVAKIKSSTYVVGPAGELADVVVFVKEAGGTAKTEPLLLDQKNCAYHPYVAAVQVNQPVNVRNSDSFMHNVHTLPDAATGNKSVNQAQFPKTPDLKYTFANAEPFLTFKCDVHPWMFSYLYVVNTPYFAVTQKDGTYKISGLPKGKYTLVAHHRRAGKVEQAIEVGDAAATQNFEIELKK